MALADVLERARARGAPRVGNTRMLLTAYRPWKAQAWLHRSRAVFRNVVAGRQSGKSHGGSFEATQAALWKPGGHVAVLVPTYKIAEAVIAKLKELLEPHFPDSWHEAKRYFELPGRRLITIWSADRKVTVRGPTITLLWIDEGAYLHVDARDAAWGSTVAVKDARCLVTTTPAGKNWVHQEFTSPDEASESFRFRTEDSPYANLAMVARLRKKMSPEKAAQEFDAVFVDNLLITFPDVKDLIVESFPSRGAEPLGNVLGVDVARDQDWTVLTLMNRFGEAEVVGRRKRPAGSEAAFYPDAVEWIAKTAHKFSAAVCIDDSGPGAVIADYLERDHKAEVSEVIRVKTNIPKTKAKIVESCQAEVQWRRIWVRRNEHSDQLVHELSTFQGIKRVVHGQEEMTYEGPQLEGEHDDCVVSLCLANWGRLNREVARDPLEGDFTGFAIEDGAAPAPAPSAGDLGGWGAV